MSSHGRSGVKGGGVGGTDVNQGQVGAGVIEDDYSG
jgi:hypothetical protein